MMISLQLENMHSTLLPSVLECTLNNGNVVKADRHPLVISCFPLIENIEVTSNIALNYCKKKCTSLSETTAYYCSDSLLQCNHISHKIYIQNRCFFFI